MDVSIPADPREEEKGTTGQLSQWDWEWVSFRRNHIQLKKETFRKKGTEYKGAMIDTIVKNQLKRLQTAWEINLVICQLQLLVWIASEFDT